MTDFMNSLTLNQLFYAEVVHPILKSHFLKLEYSAALIGWGSDVLGYDDLQSTDHNWGPRLQLFISEQDFEKYCTEIDEFLHTELPPEFLGYPTAFPIFVEDESGPVKHNVEIATIKGYFSRYLGCDPYHEIGVGDWLTFAEHKLLTITSGKVFHDGLHELEPIRQKFRYYPQEIWLYLLAAQWKKICEEEAFVGRCGYVGDELGSMLIAARQVKNLMRLCFLMERKYAPYSKWFGTAFAHLTCAHELSPIFMQILQAQEWKARQEFLATAYEIVAHMHNALGITIGLNETTAQYHGRPYLVINGDRYGEELRKVVTSEEVRNIKHNLGSINQFVDSNDQLGNPNLCIKLKDLYS